MIPPEYLDGLPPALREQFARWDEYMHTRVTFNMPESQIHAQAHCERVLLYALMLGAELLHDDPEALEILAHASIFHDTRREDEYLDRGHGARAAVYYDRYCREHPELTHHPETDYLMRYHDQDDSLGHRKIAERLSGLDGERARLLYDIFKDADALDRWRLGDYGLDPRYLRTPQARALAPLARKIVHATMDPALLASIDAQVRTALAKNNQLPPRGNGEF